MINFKDISYLKSGNTKQQKAYYTLTKLDIFNILKTYNPVLTGTIPIEIDIADSDLDIACFTNDYEEFKSILIKNYSNYNYISINKKI